MRRYVLFKPGIVKPCNELLISKPHVILDSIIIRKNHEIENREILRNIYKEESNTYPKFYKMDALSQLAFAGASILDNRGIFRAWNKERVGLLFINSWGSLESDMHHQKLIDTKNTAPSPSVFVYTLPNILIGELCIYFGWNGENLFMIDNKFDRSEWLDMAQSWIENNAVDHVIGGWVEYYQNEMALQLIILDKFCQP